MDKLLLHEGGHPLTLDDLAFIQRAIAEPLQGLLSSLGDCIISGCEIVQSQSDYSLVSPGYIHRQGKVYYATGGQFPVKVNEGELYYILSKSEEGSKVYADGQERSTQQKHTARLIWAKKAPQEPHMHMPTVRRIGYDLLRRQTLGWECSIPGARFIELSPNSGILEFPVPVGSYAYNSILGTFDLKGANYNYGRSLIIGEGMDGKRPHAITLYNGALTLTPSGVQNIADGNFLELTLEAYVSIPISWAYSNKLVKNNVGANVNTSYTGDHSGGRGSMTGRA